MFTFSISNPSPVQLQYTNENNMITVKKRQTLREISPETNNMPSEEAINTKKTTIEQPSEQHSIKVVVRVRPLLERETSEKTECVVKMDSEETEQRSITLQARKDSVQAKKYRDPQRFSFNRCLWSYDRSCGASYADQGTVFDTVGHELLNNTLRGFNSCVMAYGQTGSGKTYTMMGTREEPGLIPTVCQALFERIEQLKDIKTKVSVSFIEIYQENVIDLLGKGSKLRVRENSDKLPFVENLREFDVSSAEEIITLLNTGIQNRTTAETNLNKESSRSHSILTVTVAQEKFNHNDSSITKVKSNLKLVDLAGSEKAVASNGMLKVRQQEGTKINKSLTTLGRILTILSEKGKNQKLAVPYRESMLTWLLKENIGGNSKTTMIACISPIDFDETLSTLRFATITSKIENQARLNQETQVEMNELVRQFELERQKLLQHIEELKSRSTMDAEEASTDDAMVDSDVRKLENYVKWQNNYIETLSFSRDVAVNRLNENLNVELEKNEILTSSLLSVVNQQSKYTVSDGPDEDIDKIEELIRRVKNLNVAEPKSELANVLQDPLIQKYLPMDVHFE